MAGLFDFLRDNPAITQGLLAGGFGAMAGRGSKLQAWGQGGLAGLQGYSNAMNQQAQEQDRALAAKRQAIQEQMLQMQLENAQRQQQGQKATQGYLTQALSPVQPIDANAVSGVAGPRPEALQPVGTTPGFSVGAALKAGVPVDALPQIQQMLAPKGADYKVVGDSLVKIGPEGISPVFQSAPKAEKPSLFYKDPETGKTMVDPVVLDVERTMAQLRRPVTSVNVSTGQKGYENESKLRNDFKSEPIYKDYADMQNAYKQIKAGVAQGTPIGDVATATKMMKLLDPGSVVRESELGVAMAAGGRMDRLQNYVQMQMSGEKLTPTMRKDFSALADELMAAAGQAYNNKRNEYATMGSRYGLDPKVLGDPYKPSAPKSGGIPSSSEIDAELARRARGR